MSSATPDMKFTVIKLSPHERWGGIKPMVEAARMADDLGYYGIYLPEHIIIPVEPGVPPASTMWHDNFVLAAHLAACTKRIRLIFYVMIVPYRPPIQTAKALATLDQVSDGRLICGTGVGWLRGEFQALGLDFAQRGAMTTEYLRAMKALWTQENPSFKGKYVQFSNVSLEPKCLQKPHVPLWIGGSARASLQRAVEMGDGWVPLTGTLEDLKKTAGWVREQLRAAGRAPSTYEFSYHLGVGERDSYSPHSSATTDMTHQGARAARTDNLPCDAGAIIDALAQWQEAGFRHMYVRFNWQNAAEMMQHMEWFASKVMPAFK